MNSEELADGTPHELPDDAILLSIEPVWAEAILDGVKRWEYRRRSPAIDPPYRAILYATSPRQAAVGEAVVAEERQGPPVDVVAETVGETPHTRDDVLEYFEGCDDASALRISGASWFKHTVGLPALRQADLAPNQNFRYAPSDWFGECEVTAP